MDSRHIFLTGANGFVGSHMLERLVQLGYRVTVLLRVDSDTTRIDHLLVSPLVTTTSSELMEEIFVNNPPYIVIHMATCYRKYHAAVDIDDMIVSNVTLPTQIAQLCVTYGVRYFINTGTFFEYDFSDTPINEQSREKAFNLYAATKQSLNNLLKYYTQQYDFRVLTLRLFSPYGPRDNQKLIPVVIQSLISGKSMQIPNATQKLSFTYVEDIVDAFVLAIEKMDSFIKNFDFVNIAPQELYALSEIVSLLEAISQKESKIIIGDGMAKDTWHSSFQSNYAHELLGWESKTSIREGLTLTYNSYYNAI